MGINIMGWKYFESGEVEALINKINRSIRLESNTNAGLPLDDGNVDASSGVTVRP